MHYLKQIVKLAMRQPLSPRRARAQTLTAYNVQCTHFALPYDKNLVEPLQLWTEPELKEGTATTKDPGEWLYITTESGPFMPCRHIAILRACILLEYCTDFSWLGD